MSLHRLEQKTQKLIVIHRQKLHNIFCRISLQFHRLFGFDWMRLQSCIYEKSFSIRLFIDKHRTHEIKTGIESSCNEKIILFFVIQNGKEYSGVVEMLKEM